MKENKEKKQKDVESKELLTLRSKYGGIYFVMSVAVIIFAILLICLTIATKFVGLVYVVAGIGIVYCVALFLFERKRSKEIDADKESKNNK